MRRRGKWIWRGNGKSVKHDSLPPSHHLPLSLSFLSQFTSQVFHSLLTVLNGIAIITNLDQLLFLGEEAIDFNKMFA